MQEAEGTAGGNILGVLAIHIERSVLVAHYLRVEVDVYRHGELVVGVDDDCHTLVRNGIYLLLSYFVVFARALLLNEARLLNLLHILACRAVHNGSLGAVDVNQGVIHAHSPECRDDMLDGAYLRLTLLDCSTARCVGNILTKSRYGGRTLQIYAAENDAVVISGWMDRHIYRHSSM